MKRAEYQVYLASREWALLKEQVRARSGGRCESCPDGAHDQTHHLTYERIGRERIEDLLGVCEACHQFLSAKSDDDPAAGPDLPDVHKRVDSAGFVSCTCGTQRLKSWRIGTPGPNGVVVTTICEHDHEVSFAIVFWPDYLFLAF